MDATPRSVDRPAWPLSRATARLLFLKAVCAVAEGADVPLSHAVPDASSHCPPDVCVAAVLGDEEHRVAVLGGRAGMPRSLGSVYAGSVTRFVGGSLRGVVSRVIDTPRVTSFSNGVAVSRDGRTLLVSDVHFDSQAIHEFDVGDGSRRRIVGSMGGGPLQFRYPGQVWIASDDFVFVTDYGNNRVQVLTPTLEFHCSIGAGKLDYPVGVCANADIVVVTEADLNRVSVFDRRDGALLRRFGSSGVGDGQLRRPSGVCFMSGDRHVAVVESDNHRVSVFSVDGQFIRHVGVGTSASPRGVACSAFNELVVADVGSRCVRVYSDVGDLLMTFGDGDFSGFAVHGSTMWAGLKSSCVLLS
jgi:hypothetical protein